jgi:hypothetical protein
MRGWLAVLLSLALLGCLTGCAEEDFDDDLPGPPQPFDAQRFVDMEAGIFKSYLQLQDALAHDEFAAAQAAAQVLAGFAHGDLTDPAQAAMAAADIGTLRVAFRLLSETLIGGDVPDDMLVAYCPMAFEYEGGRWLQLRGDISNPYYGATMLRCGAFEDKTDTSMTHDES